MYMKVMRLMLPRCSCVPCQTHGMRMGLSLTLV